MLVQFGVDRGDMRTLALGDVLNPNPRVGYGRFDFCQRFFDNAVILGLFRLDLAEVFRHVGLDLADGAN